MTDIAELSESAVRDDRRRRTARAPASRRPAARRARSSRRSCRCPRAPRSSCARRCSRSTARTSTSSSPRSARRACRRLIVDGKPVDLSDGRAGSAATAARRCRDDRTPVVRSTPSSIGHRGQAREGDQGRHRRDAARRRRAAAGSHRQGREQGGGASGSTTGSCSATHHFVYGDIGPAFFVFNNPESACRTCGGLGVDKLTHPELLVPDPEAQHPRRLLRARGVQVQPGHVGRAA